MLVSQMLTPTQRLPTNVVVAILSKKGYTFTLQRLLSIAFPQVVLCCSDIMNETAIGEGPARLAMHNRKVLRIVLGQCPKDGGVGQS